MARRQLPKEQSAISLMPLDEPQCLESIRLLYKVCATCFGPCGRTKMVHNQQGGHVTVTSASCRLLKVTAISKPILKLITASVQSHIDRFLDHGLFAATLCLDLLESYLTTSINRKLIHETLHLLLRESVEYLSSEDCLCKFRINLASIQDFVGLTRSILASKPLCQFSEEISMQISTKIVELFLSVVQFSDDNNALANSGVLYITLDGYPLEDTRILDGLLFETPHIPVYRKEPIEVLTVELGPCTGQIKVVLVDVSMAGDSNTLLDVEIELSEDISLSDAVLRKLLLLAQHLVDTSVGLVACQKVIHPRVKHFLESHGVFVLQRLGLLYTEHFSVLTGANKWSSLELPLDEIHVGYLSSVRHCVYGTRSFVHLEGVQNGRVSTVVLCNRTEEAVEETKVVFQSALHALHLSMSEPYCLFGAGCWQTHLAQYINNKMEHNHRKWQRELCTDTSTLRELTTIFTQCVRKTALQLDTEADHMTDRMCSHHWTFPTGTYPQVDSNSEHLHEVTSCACGLVAYRDDIKFSHLHKEVTSCETNESLQEGKDLGESGTAAVIDCYSSAFNAFQVAVSTAAAVLSIRNIIQQK